MSSSCYTLTPIKCRLIVASLFCVLSTSEAHAAEALNNIEIMQKLEELSAQNKTLMERVQQLEATQSHQHIQLQKQEDLAQEQATKIKEQAYAVEKTQELINNPSSAVQSKADAKTIVSSYGEIGYSKPTKSSKDTNVDIGRAVIGIQHRFDDKTKMVGEFEWEHAITSSSDQGEAEVEQLWVEREFGNGIRGRAGLFLMPVGLINQNHEPTAYYGVFRPDVDTKIVPSTWREVGLGVSGNTENGFNWNVALTTSPNLSKWDATSTEGQNRGPLQAIHGEGQFAAARNLGVVGALDWSGQPGLLLGGSIVYDNIGQHQSGLANGAKLVLLDIHGRYQIAKWDLAGELIRGTISNTEQQNLSYLGTSTNSTLIPHLFYGGYVQAAYQLWSYDDYSFNPFIRYEQLNTAANFGGLSASDGAISQPDEKIVTIGGSFNIGEGIVVKADYRKYHQNKQPDTSNHFNLGDSINVGIGYSF